MDLHGLLRQYIDDERTHQIKEKASKDTPSRLHLMGLVGSASAFVAAAVFKNDKRNQLFILPDKESAAYFHNDLQSLFENKEVLFFADSYNKPAQFEKVNSTNILMRTEVLNALFQKQENVPGELIVTYPEAIFEKIRKIFLIFIVLFNIFMDNLYYFSPRNFSLKFFHHKPHISIFR